MTGLWHSAEMAGLIGQFFSNWRQSNLPYHQKLSLAIRNNWKKLRTRSGCCGHHGEPGC